MNKYVKKRKRRRNNHTNNKKKHKKVKKKNTTIPIYNNWLNVNFYSSKFVTYNVHVLHTRCYSKTIFCFRIYMLVGYKEIDGLIKTLLAHPNFTGGVLACFLDNTVPGAMLIEQTF